MLSIWASRSTTVWIPWSASRSSALYVCRRRWRFDWKMPNPMAAARAGTQHAPMRQEEGPRAQV